MCTTPWRIAVAALLPLLQRPIVWRLRELETDMDTAFDIPHRAVIPAAAVPPPETKAPRSIFDMAAQFRGDPRALFDAKGQLRPMTEWPAEVAGAVIGIKDTMAGREVKLVDKSATLEKALPTTDKREALNAVWAWWKVDHPEQPEQQGAIAT